MWSPIKQSSQAHSSLVKQADKKHDYVPLTSAELTTEHTPKKNFSRKKEQSNVIP